ncbi:MAG: CaiB/BaiF CoA transferase family protein [Pseudomonadales bacterium]
MGPLHGTTIIEIVGLGPAPFAAMMLADMGADVIRIDRPGGGTFGDYDQPQLDLLNRGKRSVCVNLKTADGVETVKRMVEKADALIEGFRPGVMERFGLGPEDCWQRNAALVYGRMTGWGQEGPLASSAGHDINYISLAGAAHAIGRAGEKPAIPLNLVGDFGGGGLMLAFGLVCALFESKSSAQGQVVDAAMIDGTAALMTSTFAAFQANYWSDNRGTNMLDGGSHFYEIFETSDGKYISLGAIEPQFYAELLEKLGTPAKEMFAEQYDIANWPLMQDQMAELIKQKTRDEWDSVFSGSDVCYAPVLSMAEVRQHPHHKARETFEDQDGVWQPKPAPRFSRTEATIQRPPATIGQHTKEVLTELGFHAEEISAFLESGVIIQKV